MKKLMILSTLLFISIFMLFGCSFNPSNYTVNEIENINDEQSRDIIYSYFSKEEQEYICSHLIQINSVRTILGETSIYKKKDFIFSDISLYDDEIKNYADYYNLPFEFCRGLTIMHELCHVLHPEDEHNSIWLEDFKSKIINYCWVEINCGNLNSIINNYKDDESLVNYIIYIKTYSYTK